MPFTPFHLGPALGFGLPLRAYLHVPTFLVANIIVDVEPLLVVLLRVNYPLHGYVHTFLAAFLLGLALGYVMFRLERMFGSLYTALLLESAAPLPLQSFLAAGVLGTTLHVLLDAPLYSDMHPFFPSSANPLYHSVSSLEVYGFCVWMGIVGVICYVALAVFWIYRKFRRAPGFKAVRAPTTTPNLERRWADDG